MGVSKTKFLIAVLPFLSFVGCGGGSAPRNVIDATGSSSIAATIQPQNLIDPIDLYRHSIQSITLKITNLQSGDILSGLSVSTQVISGKGVLENSTSATNSDGLVTFTYKLVDEESVRLRVNAGGTHQDILFNVIKDSGFNHLAGSFKRTLQNE